MMLLLATVLPTRLVRLSTVDVVANSLGGLLSVAFALACPDRVSRLALGTMNEDEIAHWTAGIAVDGAK